MAKPTPGRKPRKKAAPDNDQVAVFGHHAVTSLLKHRSSQVFSLWVLEGRRDAPIQALLDTASQLGLAVESKTRDELDQQTAGVHQGILAWAKPRQAGSESELENLLATTQKSPLLLVLDGVTDPHNLGACLRSAEAAGVDAVIVPRDKSAGLNATVRKVACGAAETLPLIQVTNLARTLRSLADYGIWIIGTSGDTETLIYQADLTRPVALVMGAEGKGMRRLTREHCDQLVRLPMAGEVSSLNVSVASGVSLYEAVRQRLPQAALAE
ncbi:23S rRNA (guanosine(2251)-2'-O)-methyltransferase RlmB [Marinospirillum sp.]|uniref:23S rRNA (guanosine(2251)-2'-O)-methyltransferase RlmB n=1 Tax=Marinospirillum sp. TaxID=2183934 RepID=UPI0028706CE9|nr:23S rRNA (guanosine(2251)-2'-O)-methyltransferase RlmB [Marinospirillum sp.]MDR9467705.1 23S rRNA (guanosine(2251)-2'-O)-methyltransferase RlmB [Marinospirillum sp.]